MVVILKPKTSEKEIERLIEELEKLNISVDKSQGSECTILGLVGDTSNIDPWVIESNECVQRVMKVQEPFKKANRMFHPGNTVININGNEIGGNKIAIIAGPCSVEDEDQITLVAKEVKKYGAGFLRGGAFKPRTSPYSFQGLELEGLKLMQIAKQETGLQIVSELMSPSYIDEFVDTVDIIQIGARNMQNYDLLKQVGKTNKPIILKRGLSSTIEEWLLSAEHIMAQGNENIILCERGIRTYETYTRNTLDLSAIPVVKSYSHLPIIVDPSHATGHSRYVESMAMASIAAGCDGLMIEVHNNPKEALSDGQQSVTPKEFDSIMKKVNILSNLQY